MTSTSSESSQNLALSLIATIDDINRMNHVLNDGNSEECFLAFVKHQEWCRIQWQSAQNEAMRLQNELDEALKQLAQWEGKFANVRRLLDAEKMERQLAVKRYEALEKQMVMARDLLFNDNRNKLNDETLEKLAFLNATGRSTCEYNNHKLNMIPEHNSTGTMLSEVSISRSEDDLDEYSFVNKRKSWMYDNNNHRQNSKSPKTPTQPRKKRRSSTSSATKVVELESGKVLATATTTLTLQRGALEPEIHVKTPNYETPSSETSDEIAPKPNYLLRSASKNTLTDYTPTAPICTETETGSEGVWNSPRLSKQHKFVTKTFFKNESCTPCNKRMKFGKSALRCENCRAAVHNECRDLLPLPCLPPPATPKANPALAGIADYAPSRPPMIPALLVHCINEVEKRGLNEKGIYRISGQERDVKRLKERFIRNGCPPLSNEDIHVICGTIKDFLRSLREPLVTNSLWDDFINAAKIEEESDATAAIYQAVSQLPQPNRDTLAFLMLHLQKVAESEECQMGIDNLAKIFGPTVLRYSTTHEDMYSVTSQLIATMRLLLTIRSEYWAQFACTGDITPSPYRTQTQATQLIKPPSDTALFLKKYFRG